MERRDEAALEDNKKLVELYSMAKNIDVPIRYIDIPDVVGTTIFVIDTFHILINSNIDEDEEVDAVSHEMGHVKKGIATELSPLCVHRIYEERAKNWAATYLVPHDEYERVLHNPYVQNDWEAAEEIGVDIETLQRARRRYELQGLPVSQAGLGCVYREP